MLKRLSKGDTIGIINPSFKNPNEDKDAYKYVIDAIKKRGYNVLLGKSFYAKEGYLAGSDELRAEDLNDMFRNKDVKLILCMRGGYGATRMVDLVDYALIKENPKIVCGFSDVTVLINAINKKTDIVQIHGLVGFYIGSKSCDEFSTNDFWKILEEKQKGRILKNPNDNCTALVKGKAKGKLVGGNLSLIATLVGSEYEVDFTDKIVFIEEVSEEPYQIDRYLSSIRLRGCLEKAKGFVFGHFSECLPSESRKNTQTVEDVIKDYILKLNKPTIINFASGHDFPFINLPIGALVTLDADNLQIIIEEEIYE